MMILMVMPPAGPALTSHDFDCRPIHFDQDHNHEDLDHDDADEEEEDDDYDYDDKEEEDMYKIYDSVLHIVMVYSSMVIMLCCDVCIEEIVILEEP